jgi:hypothetical protein
MAFLRANGTRMDTDVPQGDFGIEAEWDTFSREGKPAIECGFICQKHFEIYDARTPEPEAKLKEKNQ